MSVPGAVTVASALLCAFAGGFSLMLARAPRWPEQQWFAITAFAASLFTACRLPDTIPHVSNELRFVFAALAMCGGQLNVIGWLVLSRIHLRRPVSTLDRALIALLLAAIPLWAVPGLGLELGVLPVEVPWLGTTYLLIKSAPLGAAIYALDCGGVLLALFRYARGMSLLSGGARWNVLGLTVFLCAATNDALVGVGLYRAPLMLALAYLIPVVTLAVTQAERVVRSARDLDQLSSRLEREIAARSQALLDTRRLLDRSERLAAIGQLAAGVAHEVNNPAAALKGNLSYLKESLQTTGVPADAVVCIEESLSSVERIARIVRELCDSARAAGGAIEAEPVELLGAVRAAQAALRTPLSNARLELDIPPGTLVQASEGHLVQVLTNLLNNALQAARAGEQPQLSLRARNVDEQIQIAIEDRGVGMTPETLKRLFEPFFTTKPVGQGTGLGLAVSRGLVNAMGGTLHFESESGQGTRAIVQLAAAHEPVARKTPLPGAPEEPGGQRILLVEEDPEVRMGLSRMLRARFLVESAASVQEGLVKALATPRPDVIVCELLMADGGGHQLHNLLAASHPELAERIIFLTGPGATPEVAALLAQRPQPVIVKPLDLASLSKAMRELQPRRREKVA